MVVFLLKYLVVDLFESINLCWGSTRPALHTMCVELVQALRVEGPDIELSKCGWMSTIPDSNPASLQVLDIHF